MTEALEIRTPHADVSDVVRELAPSVDDLSIRLPCERPIADGEWVRFSIFLSDGNPVFEGIGRSQGTRPDGPRYRVHLSLLQFDERNEIMYERMLLARDAEEERTGTIDLRELGAELMRSPSRNAPPPVPGRGILPERAAPPRNAAPPPRSAVPPPRSAAPRPRGAAPPPRSAAPPPRSAAPPPRSAPPSSKSAAPPQPHAKARDAGTASSARPVRRSTPPIAGRDEPRATGTPARTAPSSAAAGTTQSPRNEPTPPSRHARSATEPSPAPTRTDRAPARPMSAPPRTGASVRPAPEKPAAKPPTSPAGSFAPAASRDAPTAGASAPKQHRAPSPAQPAVSAATKAAALALSPARPPAALAQPQVPHPVAHIVPSPQPSAPSAGATPAQPPAASAIDPGDEAFTTERPAPLDEGHRSERPPRRRRRPARVALDERREPPPLDTVVSQAGSFAVDRPLRLEIAPRLVARARALAPTLPPGVLDAKLGSPEEAVLRAALRLGLASLASLADDEDG